MSVHTEAAFESSIEAHLLDHGWSPLTPSAFDRSLGLFPDELFGFLEESQPDQWKQLVLRLGGESSAREKSSRTSPASWTCAGR